MGKIKKSAEFKSLISEKVSEDSKNQGFLNFSGEKATHCHAVAESTKSRKGLKSGEPFSAPNHINQEAKEGRN